jgi:uncharacterized protein (DUF849 family)
MEVEKMLLVDKLAQLAESNKDLVEKTVSSIRSTKMRLLA